MLEHDELIKFVKNDIQFSDIDFSKSTIDDIGEKLFLSNIEAEASSYVSQPNYWKQLKQEFRKLFCTSNKKYHSLRKDISKLANKSYATIVSTIAAAMASQFGVIAGVLVPFCALILVAVLKVGKEAFCANASLDIFIE